MLERSCMRQIICWSFMVALVHSSPTPPTTDYEKMGVSYDEYPVVVPKRAAILLDRLMVALQKAVDSNEMDNAMINRIPIDDKMDLQRRGQQKGGRTYWRCYFNAVTCF